MTTLTVSILIILSICHMGKSDLNHQFETIVHQLEHSKLVKRSDGLMHELVSILVEEQLERKGLNNTMAKIEHKMDTILKILSDRNKVLSEKLNATIMKEIGEAKKQLSKQIASKITIKFDGVNNEILALTRQLTSEVNSTVNTVRDEILLLKNSSVSRSGAVYIRWGKRTCPTQDTKLIYSGYAAGSHYTKNSAANTQCLPTDPNWRKYQDSIDSGSTIYGAEYETHAYVVGELLHKNHYQYDVPCAVCQSTKRSKHLMIPGKDRCHYGWHLEYRGYLMSEAENHGASEYNCVDANPDIIGSRTNHNGKLFYPVEARCGSLKCPPYVQGRELTCAVCTI